MTRYYCLDCGEPIPEVIGSCLKCKEWESKHGKKKRDI